MKLPHLKEYFLIMSILPCIPKSMPDAHSCRQISPQSLWSLDAHAISLHHQWWPLFGTIYPPPPLSASVHRHPLISHIGNIFSTFVAGTVVPYLPLNQLTPPYHLDLPPSPIPSTLLVLSTSHLVNYFPLLASNYPHLPTVFSRPHSCLCPWAASWRPCSLDWCVLPHRCGAH